MKILKTYSQLFESIGILRNKVYEKLNLAKNDCYEDDYENSVAIQELKDILGFEFDYDMGCSFNSIELSNIEHENILNLLDIDEEELMLLVFPDSYDYPVPEHPEEYEKFNHIIKEINNVFNIDSSEILSFNHIIRTIYDNMFEDIANVYNINVIDNIKKIQDNLIFEVSTDTISIYLDLIDSNLSTVEEAFQENVNNSDTYLIGSSNLTTEEEKERDDIVKENLIKILNYCKENREEIINDICKLNSIDIPELGIIKYYGGDFLKQVKSYDYQKKKIISKFGNVKKSEYIKFKNANLLNQDIIRYKNMKEKSKRFNL